MVKIDDIQVKEYENDLQKFKERAFPFATKQTINNLAFETKKIAQETIKNKMITKNKFTVNSIRVDKAKTLRLSRQESVVGSTLDYMEIQEFGGDASKVGKYAKVVPTSESAGQGRSNPRTKLPTRANKLANIRLTKGRRTKFRSKKQEVFLKTLEAVNSGNKFVFLDGDENNTGIYKVKGLAKKKGKFTRIKMKMMYSMRRNKNIVKPTPWLFPSTMKANDRRQEFYNEALKFQLKRHNLFKG